MAPKAKIKLSTASSKQTPTEIILFCSPQKEWGVFSTWYTQSDGHFTVNEQVYHNVEQFMQAGKARLFGDDLLLEQILENPSPKEVKQLGSHVTTFDESVWESMWPDLLVTATQAKFAQNEGLGNILLSTEKCPIGYAAPKGGNWGIGMSMDDPHAFDTSKWSQNRIGSVLMQIRGSLSESKPSLSLPKSLAKPKILTKLAAIIKDEPARGPVCVCVNGFEGPVFGPAEVAGSTTVSSLMAQILAITKPAESRRPKLMYETCMLSDADELPKVPDGDQLTLSIVYLNPLQYEDFEVKKGWEQPHRGPRAVCVIYHKPTMTEQKLQSTSLSASWGKTVRYADVQILEADDGIVAEYTRIDGFDDPSQEEMGLDDDEYAELMATHQPTHTKHRYKLDLIEGKGLIWGPKQ